MCHYIKLRVGNSWRPVKLMDIVRFEADGSYTRVYLNDGTVITQSWRLQVFEARVKGSKFFVRASRSQLINYNYVITFGVIDGVVLENTTALDLSEEAYEKLEAIFV
jgi:two-component system, LytTR family, response regulator